MSFDGIKELVEAGDTIVMFMGREPISIEVDVTKTHQSKFGAFPHKNFIGKKYGNKVHSSNGKGWTHILRPTPELWTVTLPHRTQILYTMDISMIIFELELKPGSIVVESGTGSGSLSHAIIRTVKPTGHLYTFDFHQNRVQKAKEEFDKHYGAGKYVTCQCADACVNGYSMKEKADAVFLDLPAPWDAVKNAKEALKKFGSRLCSFSPCIEQVQRTCEELRKEKFCEIKTIECLLRPLNVTTTAVPELVFDSSEYTLLDEKEAKKMKLNGDFVDEGKVNEQKDKSNDKMEITPNGQEKNHTAVNSYGMVTKVTAKSKKGNINVLTCKPNMEMTGHTGFLTFASLHSYRNENL